MQHNPFDFNDHPTLQEIFDRGVEFFSRPDAVRCVGADGLCVYTNHKNNHCVVGYMAPQQTLDAYRQEIGDIFAMSNRCGHYTPGWISNNLRFLNGLQAIHDDFDNWTGGKLQLDRVNYRLQNLATEYDLKYKEITDGEENRTVPVLMEVL